MALGWLIPGLGHFIMKRPKHGVLYAAIIFALLVAGLWMSKLTAVDFDLHPVYFVCQIGGGALVVASQFLFGGNPVGLGEDIGILTHQSGVVYVAVAGVLNIIVLCELVRRHLSPDAPGPADTMRADAIAAMRAEADE